jgi:Holliday junction DNA helicase RuvA
MIAYLSGTLLSKHPNQLIIDVNGVGYEVTIPLSTFYETGEVGGPIQLHIYTHVREDAIALFGFKSVQEKSVFEQLISVSGIGPRLGITILSGMPFEQLVPTIRQANLAKLTSIPGVGKKTAERLVVDLRDKLVRFEISPPASVTVASPISQAQEDVLSVLLNLGYSKNVAENAIRKSVSAEIADQSFENLLKSALQHVSR